MADCQNGEFGNDDEDLEKIWQRIFGAVGKRNYDQLFADSGKEYLDKLSLDEFHDFMRMHLKVSPTDVNDSQITALFQMLDLDGNNTVEIQEIALFANSWSGCEEDEETPEREEETTESEYSYPDFLHRTEAFVRHRTDKRESLRQRQDALV